MPYRSELSIRRRGVRRGCGLRHVDVRVPRRLAYRSLVAGVPACGAPTDVRPPRVGVLQTMTGSRGDGLPNPRRSAVPPRRRADRADLPRGRTTRRYRRGSPPISGSIARARTHLSEFVTPSHATFVTFMTASTHQRAADRKASNQRTKCRVRKRYARAGTGFVVTSSMVPERRKGRSIADASLLGAWMMSTASERVH